MAWVSPYIGRIHTAYYGWGDSSIWMVPETAILYHFVRSKWACLVGYAFSIAISPRLGWESWSCQWCGKVLCCVYFKLPSLTTNSKRTWKWMVGRWSFPFGVAVASWQVLLLVSGSVCFIPRWWLITFHYVTMFPPIPGEMIQFDLCIFCKWVGSTTKKTLYTAFPPIMASFG